MNKYQLKSQHILADELSMKFPDNVDLDKLVNFAHKEVVDAIQGWLKGGIPEEVALMSRLVENLSRERRSCDIGVKFRMVVTSEVAVLHRKGPKQTDKYGADLALTVYSEDRSFIKTSIFQLKKSRSLHLELEKRQIVDTLIDQRIAERSFIFAVDEVRECVRLSDVQSLASKFHTSDQKSFDCSDWMTLTEWIKQWFSCEVGKPSIMTPRIRTMV